MMLKRIMGKASFATVRDFTGDMQYFITKGDIGEEAYAAWKTFDLGDIVAVQGHALPARRPANSPSVPMSFAS